MQPPHPRRPRFQRANTPLRLTSDDLAILDHVRSHRFLRSTHLIRLLAHRPAKKLIERLGSLYHAGYLDRPRAQLDYFAHGGSAPMVYALGDRSSSVLSTTGDADWSDKNRDVRRPYIEHTLMVADIMVAIEVAARARSDIEFIDAERLLPSYPQAPQARPWRLSAEVVDGRVRHSVALIPDAVFALRFRVSDRCAYFFLEADRGTMPIDRADLAQSSIRRKLLAYQAALKARQHVERFGFANLRVLTVTTGADRLRSMLAALDDVTHRAPTGRFLFAEHADAAATDPLAAAWATNGSAARIDVPPGSPRTPFLFDSAQD